MQRRTLEKLFQLLKSVLFLSSVLILCTIPSVSALSTKQLLQKGINYYDSLGGETACNQRIDEGIVVGLDDDIVKAVNQNKDVYLRAEAETQVPWQLLAGIHYRETTFATSGDNIYQIIGYSGGGDLEEQTLMLAQRLQNDYVNRNLENHREKMQGIATDPEVIKDTLYSYNGRSSLYAEQAQELGFDPEKQPYEGSPYVMNQFDDLHRDMGIITIDHGTIDGTDTRLGAFTVYSRLGGASSGCQSGTGRGADVVRIARGEIGNTESPLGSNCGPEISKYTDGVCEAWCADFVSWVYKEAGVPFTGGLSGGWRLPAALEGPVMWLRSRGVWINNGPNASEPQPGDVIYYNWDYVPFSEDDHVGLVEKVDGATLHTIEGNSSDQVSQRSYTNFRSNPAITGWGRMK